jgi:predicted flap endonuclease-1-like 5' DNA nuclease
MEFVAENWLVIAVAAILVLILLFLLVRPRQRVTLSDSTPRRPHMAGTGEGRGLIDVAAAAASDVTGEIVGAHVHAELPGAAGPPDDLQLLKGVGPKLAAMLGERGIIRFDQLAKLSPGQVEAIDSSLGAFRGRLQRDRVAEQADYLARGDRDGYEAKFGKL